MVSRSWSQLTRGQYFGLGTVAAGSLFWDSAPIWAGNFGLEKNGKPETEMDKERCIGLALGAGGANGLAHILMLEVFEELGLVPHAIAGSSIIIHLYDQ
jgi:NTE family protein